MAEHDSEVDVGKRRDDALRRALNTPPQPKPSQKTMDREFAGGVDNLPPKKPVSKSS